MLAKQRSRSLFILLPLLALLGCGITNKEVFRVGNSLSGNLSANTDLDANTDSDGDGISDADESSLGTDPKNPDSDGDGLTDGDEINTYKTNPLIADTDEGGVNDGTEVKRGSNPLDPKDDIGKDSDNDGLTDSQEDQLGTDLNNPDSDKDGLTDGAEVNTHKTNPLIADTDEGGIIDGDEVLVGSDPLDPEQEFKTNPAKDSDRDGLSDEDEKNKYKTDPNNPDSDNDGLKDGYEVNTTKTDPLDHDTDDGGTIDGIEINKGLNPHDPSDDNSDLVDNDNDGLNGAEEKEYGTDPYNSDTDEDGLKDGAEVNTHKTDPLKRDTDKGGIVDGIEVTQGYNPLDPSDDIHLKPISIKFIESPGPRTHDNYAKFVFEVSPSERVDSVYCGVTAPFIKSVLRRCKPGKVIHLENLAPAKYTMIFIATDKKGKSYTTYYYWEVVKKGKDSCQGKHVKEITHSLEFKKTTQACQWGINGNLDKKHPYVQAVRQQEVKVYLPKTMKICDVDVEFPKQTVEFDDNFVLEFNKNVIATNGLFLLTNDNGKMIFDFDRIKGMRWGIENPYCITGAECMIPRHNTSLKDLRIDLGTNLRVALKDQLQKEKVFTARLNVVGDDDPSDCQHSGLEGTLKVKYYVPSFPSDTLTVPTP